MSIDEDFAEFVAARWGSLYRVAYLLAASPAGAEDLLQTTLEARGQKCRQRAHPTGTG